MAHNLFTVDYTSVDSKITDLEKQADQANWSTFLRNLQHLPHFSSLGIFSTVVEERAKFIRSEFKDVVFLGTGGSSLGGQMITALQYTNSPNLHFMDNIDPHSFYKLFERLDLDNTAVVATSKSGSTMETVAQILWWLKKFIGRDIAKHFTVITECNPNVLRNLALHHNITCLDHPQDIGGRFAALTVVGELPARIAGLDVHSLHQGAQQVLAYNLDSKKPDALVGAVSAIELNTKGIKQSVLMPYVDRLETFGEWFCQLWAESLGKQGFGTTPIGALGAVDQHSQLQLYLDGPHDKMFTLIMMEKFQKDEIVQPSKLAGGGIVDLMQGRTMGDLLMAEQEATLITLRNHDLPARAIRLQHLDEQVLGGLMAHFIIETLAAAHLWRVNPFDQPAVEEGKLLARTYLEQAV